MERRKKKNSLESTEPAVAFETDLLALELLARVELEPILLCLTKSNFRFVTSFSFSFSLAAELGSTRGFCLEVPLIEVLRLNSFTFVAVGFELPKLV